MSKYLLLSLFVFSLQAMEIDDPSQADNASSEDTVSNVDYNEKALYVLICNKDKKRREEEKAPRLNANTLPVSANKLSVKRELFPK